MNPTKVLDVMGPDRSYVFSLPTLTFEDKIWSAKSTVLWLQPAQRAFILFFTGYSLGFLRASTC